MARLRPRILKRVTNDPMESEYVLFHTWVRSVEQAGSTDVAAVRQATIGQTMKSPSGRAGDEQQPSPVKARDGQRDPSRRAIQHRLSEQTVLIPEPWGRYLEEDKCRIAD